MKTSSLLSRLIASSAVVLSTCLLTNAQTVIIYAPVTLVDGSTPGYYNASLGTILDGTAPQFPLPFGAGGADPLIYPSDEPNLSAATNILGNWLTPHAVLNPTNWLNAPTIPATWADNTETAIIYEINGGTHGITNLIGNFDADNGLFVWVNGQFKFGARGPGLPSPAGQFEYTNVFLGNLNAGTNRIQILREDSGISAGFQIRIMGNPLGGTPLPSCAPVNPSLVGWWRAEGSGADSANTNTGILLGGTGIAAGHVGQAFKFDGVDDSVRIPVSGPFTMLDVSLYDGFTIEAWVNPSRLTIGPIAEWNNGAGGEGVHLWHSVDSIAAGDGPGNLYANIVDTSGVSHQIVSPSGRLATNTYSHVALTYNKSNGHAVIYVNGGAVKTQNLGIFTPQTGYDFHIGRRPSGFFSENLFQGGIDEVSLYNSALTASEIRAIATAGNLGKCSGTTNPPVVTCAPAPTGLVNWWQGEGNTTDNLGNIPGGLYGGTTFASGKVGQAFSFDGINDCVTNSVWGLTNIVDSYTMEFWAMPTAARAVTGENTVGTDGHGNQRYAIFPYPGPTGGILGAGISVGTNGVSVVEHGPAYIPTLLVYNGPIIGWNHIAVVYSNRQPSLYINGVFVRTGLTSLNPSCPSTWLGERGDASVNQGFYAGLLDEFSIYNRSLSASEVQSIYNASSAGKCSVTNPPVVNCTPAPTGMVSWWRADGNGLDSADGNNGTLFNGATFTPGKVGQSFGFNGANSYVNVPSSAALKPTGSLTFEAWIKYSGNPGAVSSYCIAAKGIDAEAAMDWALTVSANNRLRPHVNVNGSWQYFDCATSLSADTWYHVAMIYDGQHLQGYVNGSLDGSVNVTGSVRTSDASLRIGAYAPVNGTSSKAFFTGSIDEAAFYNRNLSIGELSAIFTAGSVGKCPPSLAFNPADGLIAHYPFIGNASDVSGNENHGNPSNAVLAVDRFGSPNAAFSFNGQNAAITVTDNPALRSLTSNYTFNAWVRFGSNPQIDAAILMKSAGAGDQRKWTFWQHVQASPYGIGLLLNRVPGGLFQWNNNYSFTTNQWFMVTFSASTGNSLIAVDGQVVSAQSGNLVLPDTTGLAMSIGGAEPGGNQWFNGSLDDIRIYNRTFSSNDIAQLYQLESSPPPTTVAAVPVITSVYPIVANIGSSVTVFGTNFSPVASNNIVYFGAVRAGVTAASASSLTVSVPAGAIHAPITVTVGKLTAASPAAFLPSFVGNGSNVTASSFAPGQNLTVADGPLRTVIADMDGDGKPDLVEANAYAHNISLFRNISVTGTLDGSSFAPRVDFPTLGGTDSPRCMTVADVDGDGKLDVLVGDQATSSVLVYRNIATPGTLTTGSLAAPVSFAAGSYPHGLRVADLDGDGLPEILVANHSGNSISILRNLGTAGSLTTNSFAAQYALAAGANPTDVAIADFNGDGKPDLVTTAFGGSQLSVFRNVAAPGAAVSNWFTLDTTLPALSGSLEFAVADMDGDAKSDLVVASVHGYAVSVYRNQAGAGAFNSSSFAARVDFGAPGWVHNVVVGDFNGDAKPDLAVTGELNSYMAVFQNQSTPGSFTTSSLAARVDYATGWNAWGVAAGDLDGDNRADIVFANTYDDTLTFYRNIISFGESTNPPIACVNSPSGLVSWWPGEQATTDIVSSNNGSLGGNATYATGLVGSGFAFDGDRDGVNLGNPASLQLQNFTIEAWIKRGSATICSLDQAQGPGGVMLSYGFGGYGFGVFDSGELFLTEIGLTYVGSPLFVTDTNYHHVAVTKSGGAVTFYLDGVASPVANYNPTFQFVTEASIGAVSVDRRNSFFGRVDELSVYSRALSSGEIQSIVVAGSAGKCSGSNQPPVCVPIPSGSFAWWQAETNTYNSVSGGSGSFASPNYNEGKVGTAFDFNGANNVVVADQPSFNPTNALTIECWVYPRALTTSYAQDLVSKDGEFSGPRQYMLTMGPPPGLDNGTGGFRAHVGVPGGFFYFIDGATKAQINTWYHVAMTYDGATLKLFINGNLDAQLAVTGPIITSSEPIRLGGGAPGNDPAYFFNGRLDEVALYGRALSQNEIQAIYNSGGAGKCPPQFSQPSITQQPQSVTTNVSATVRFDVAATGVPTPTYQWFFGNTPLANQTNAALILSNVQPAHAGLYSVQVSNIAGMVVSSNALLTVDLTQPAWLVDANSPGFYNDSLGTTLDGTSPQFPMPFGSGGGDPEFYPAGEPNLAAGAAILGNWLTNPASLNSHWRSVTSIPTTWELNTETAIIYVVNGGDHGVSNLRADIDADNGIYVWVNGKYKFGARQPGLPSPLGQYEYTNIFLGELAPGSNYIQILREDSGIADGYQFRLSGTVLATNQPPIITQSPATQTAIGGNTVTFNGAAIGSPDLTFQWRFNGVAIAGQSNNSLTLANVQLSQAGAYTFVAANPYGAATSSVATLTVLAFPPVITRQPTNVTVIVGSTATLSVQATGSVTLAYQWLLNGSPLAGRTSTSLAFQSAQFSNAGNYSVIVTNPYGSVTSSVAVLTVNPIPPCAAIHDGLVSWWKGENNAIDNWDSNNAYSFRNEYQNGKVGRAFSLPLISVNDSPSLRATNGLTLEAWVNPSTLSSVRVLVSKFDYPLFQPGVSQSAYLLGTTNNGALFFTLTPNGSVRTNTTLVTTNLIPLNQWTHVAATYDGSVMRLYINGTQIGQTNYTGKIFPGSAPLGIGGFAGPSFQTSSPWQYSGLMDEVSLYNRALSAAEIQSIVAADLTGKCFAPPVITQQPQDQIVPLGEDVKFSVAVSGSRPLAYQWYLNGFGPQYRVIGATNASLLIEKVRTNNAGHYFVTVTNSVGSTGSVRAQLSTLPAPSCTEILPGLISWWPGDTNTLDAMGLNNIGQYSPVSYPTGKVASAFTFNGSQSRITINNSASLNFTNNQNFSIEMWIKATNPPAQVSQQFPNVPLLEKRDSFSTGWLGYSLSLNNGKLAFAMGAPISLAGGRTNQMFISSGPELRDGFFHHVAVTVNRTENNGGVLYVDGSPVLVFDPRGFTNSLLNQLALYIGGPVTTISNSYYTGLIDEPAIYNRALTAAEILSIRTAGAAGRCKAKPIIVTQPANTNGVAGQNIALSVQATGTPLLRYQWRRTNQPLAGATNATYNITNLSTANIGTYSVIISNAFGTVTSSNAVVALANIPPIAYPGVVSGFEDSQIQIAMQGNDPDNKQPNQGLFFFITSGPTNGVLSDATNSFLRTYTPNPNFFGTDTFTFVANDGIASSSNATFTITVRPVNDAPTAQSQLVATDEDTPIAITLQASDMDGDALTYQVTPPSRGMLSGVAPNLIYTPETNYFGEDLFTFTVTDASNVVSQIAAVGITIRPINDAPVAKIVIAPLDELPGVTNTVLIAPACCDATLLLDGSQSTDVENDALTYIWLDGTNVIATAATVTNRFRPGTHNITLVVSDGITADMQTMIVEIITPSEVVAFLKSLVEDSITERRLRSPLVAWLRGAEESFERCHVELGVRFLEMFQQRVRDRIAPNDAELAQQLVDTAQAIIDAAPDCEPCHRLGRKGKRGHHDHDDHGRDRDERRDTSEVRGGRSSPR